MDMFRWGEEWGGMGKKWIAQMEWFAQDKQQKQNLFLLTVAIDACERRGMEGREQIIEFDHKKCQLTQILLEFNWWIYKISHILIVIEEGSDCCC